MVGLSNLGTAALAITSVTLTGVNPGDFADTSACGASLAAGSSCNISVNFTPASTTTFSASLSVADNATGSPQAVPLTGTGIASSAPQAVLSPTTLSFPSTTVNSTSAAMSATLSNPGNAALNITSVTLRGANAIDFAHRQRLRFDAGGWLELQNFGYIHTSLECELLGINYGFR